MDQTNKVEKLSLKMDHQVMKSKRHSKAETNQTQAMKSKMNRTKPQNVKDGQT